MADWDSTSLKLNRASSDTLSVPRVSHLPESDALEPEIEGKWRPRTTLLFIIASCALLWGGIFAAVFSLI